VPLFSFHETCQHQCGSMMMVMMMTTFMASLICSKAELIGLQLPIIGCQIIFSYFSMKRASSLSVLSSQNLEQVSLKKSDVLI
jgi:hypothetical protein